MMFVVPLLFLGIIWVEIKIFLSLKTLITKPLTPTGVSIFESMMVRLLLIREMELNNRLWLGDFENEYSFKKPLDVSSPDLSILIFALEDIFMSVVTL